MTAAPPAACPFCGSGRVTVIGTRYGHQVCCGGCGSRGRDIALGPAGRAAAEAAAAEAWNQRAPGTPAPPRAGAATVAHTAIWSRADHKGGQ